MSILSLSSPSWLAVTGAIVACLSGALLLRIIYNLYFHPLAAFPGPWYAAAFSLTDAAIAMSQKEHLWLQSLIRKYGTDRPIRIQPNTLLFSKVTALNDIYWGRGFNTKSTFYAGPLIGPPNLFTTLRGEDHRRLRKVLGGDSWSTSAVLKKWESTLDDQTALLVRRLREQSSTGPVDISARLAEYAADIMTLTTFSEAWGFVEHSHDARSFLSETRAGLTPLAVITRFRFLRERIYCLPSVARWLAPKPEGKSGLDLLVRESYRQVSERVRATEEKGEAGRRKDFLQQTVDARIDDAPIPLAQKYGHVTLLLLAGADTTGSALGSTFRNLLEHPAALARCRAEIDAADAAGRLAATGVRYDDTRAHLPFTAACIRETLRLNPPAHNFFPRMSPPGGAVVDGVAIPGGVEATCHTWIVNRDPGFYGADADAFRPERWMGRSEAELNRLIHGSFTFGAGPRECLGRNLSIVEQFKLVPELLRRLDFELVDPGFITTSPIAYHTGVMASIKPREEKA